MIAFTLACCNTRTETVSQSQGSSIAMPMNSTLQLNAATGKPAYTSGERIWIDLTFVNSGQNDINVTLPLSADARGVFAYTLVDALTGVETMAKELDPRSFVAYTQSVVAAGGTLSMQRRHIRFQVGKEWQILPPRGRYRIICTYDEAKAQGDPRSGGKVLRAETQEFVVEDP